MKKHTLSLLLVIIGICLINADFPNSKIIKKVEFTTLQNNVKAVVRVVDGQLVLTVDNNKISGYQEIQRIIKSAEYLLQQPDNHCFHGDNECENLPAQCEFATPYLYPNPCYQCNYQLTDEFCHNDHIDEQWDVECNTYTQAMGYIIPDTPCVGCNDIVTVCRTN